MKQNCIISSFDDENFFTMKTAKRIIYFYLQKHLIKLFGKYLMEGIFAEFECEDKAKIHKGRLSYQVLYFYRIEKRGNRRSFLSFYDLCEIRNGIRNLVNKMDPILFIDFEMNMQDYKPIANFEQEIIEAGLVLTDSQGAIRKMEHYYIKPTKFPRLTARTMRFLGYNRSDLEKAISFNDFYYALTKINEVFNPCVVVWGKSDISQFEKCISLNKLPPLKLHFINLLQLHINYDNLTSSPGLFRQYVAYTDTELPNQKHDSLEDALITKDVFFLFKNKINKG